MSDVRVRFAPSPTGSLHLGGARTALYNYLFAKHHGGRFILRVEDTDQERNTKQALAAQLRDLHWLGLNADEGVIFNVDQQDHDQVGDKGPYFQSQRKAIYQAAADQLLASGQAYYCFLTDGEIDAQREQAKAANQPFRINSPFRDVPLVEAKEKLKTQSATLRFKMPEQTTTVVFQDRVRGEVKLPSHMIGDFVLMRSDGMPVYNFACAIDDAKMGISHVFRGEEHLSNTLRQILVLRALGLPVPEYGHLSIILGQDKRKLSKRDGAVSVDDYRQQGYLPEGLINYLSLLGWTPQDEVASKQVLIDQFDGQHLHAASPVFDPVKLSWMNGQWIQQLSSADFWQQMIQFVKPEFLSKLPDDSDWQQLCVSWLQPSIQRFSEVNAQLPQVLSLHQIQKDLLDELDTAQLVIDQWSWLIDQVDSNFLTPNWVKDQLQAMGQTLGLKGKKLFLPLRLLMTGQSQGGDLKTILSLIPVSRQREWIRQRAGS
ncbi:glutamate--tRNA ligase [Gammaproteobacteria bacterium]|nr:glutamate--tRNA ligase [Gammaproteobacteria bacterium]